MDHNSRILLVEDTADDELLILMALRRSGVEGEVTVVRDGQEALDYLFGAGKFAGRDPRDLPRVMLLDLKLPKVDGLGVLQRVRSDERTRLLPIVILTSSDEDRDRRSSYGLGANSFVRKPMDFERFNSALDQLGRYWLRLNQPPPTAGTA